MKKAKCILCKKSCNSWWAFQVGLAKKDKPLCIPCMEELNDRVIKHLANTIFKGKYNGN